MEENKLMQRCLELAQNGMGTTSPNPMAGCVITHQNKIIGEGYHTKAGEPHAEVHAIHSVMDKTLLPQSTLYVNLEPCSHFGKTPPCADLIIQHNIPKIRIGIPDSNPQVAGKGIQKLKEAGCDVKVGICEKECKELNKRFITFHTHKRPYIILKWAQTQDGFIDMVRKPDSPNQPNWITNECSRMLVHKWRSEEDAIMIGTNTAILDNPELTVRNWKGKNPVRLLIDKSLRVPKESKIYNPNAKTIVFNTIKEECISNTIEFVKLNFNVLLSAICDFLYHRNILSLIVEGGAQLITGFIHEGLWDEARIFTGNRNFIKGHKAPELPAHPMYSENIADCHLSVFKNEI